MIPAEYMPAIEMVRHTTFLLEGLVAPREYMMFRRLPNGHEASIDLTRRLHIVARITDSESWVQIRFEKRGVRYPVTRPTEREAVNAALPYLYGNKPLPEIGVVL